MAYDPGSSNSGRGLGGPLADPLPEGRGGASRSIGDWNTSGGSRVRDILRKAAQSPQEPMGRFGSGQAEPVANSGPPTLGSDQVASQPTPDRDAPSASLHGEETAVRQITFWRNGFSVGDSALMRYDDPQHARLLEDINKGFAPPALLKVRVGQLVELRVMRRLEEDFVPTRSPAARGESAAAVDTTVPGSFPGAAGLRQRARRAPDADSQ
ncbi:SEP-domain-containing protein [Auricularia subglabra TFB-10046 SS5]|nr:SEP-domain-containing protein [Auricularia subglabra TFB-10046 SS5]